MLHIAQLLGTASPKSYAAHAVWHDSTTQNVKWHPTSKKMASKIWHNARLWDRSSRVQGKHGGAIGRPALAVLYALLWDCLNWKTGQLDPSIDTLSRLASVGRTATINALKRLKSLKIITWIRRTAHGHDADGHFRLRQLTNAYGVATPDQWPRPNPPPPPDPHPSTLGFPEPIEDTLQQAIAATTAGDTSKTYSLLMSDQTDRLAVALAQLGRAMRSI